MNRNYISDDELEINPMTASIDDIDRMVKGTLSRREDAKTRQGRTYSKISENKRGKALCITRIDEASSEKKNEIREVIANPKRLV